MSDPFHSLAKDAGNKLRAYILSISTAATGVFFLSLTNEKVIELNNIERISLSIAFTFFAATAFICLYELHIDAKRFYRVAKENEKKIEEQTWEWNTKMKAQRLKLICWSYITLIIASLSTLIYMTSRVYIYH